MRKQLSFRRLTLFVLSVLFLAIVTVAGIGIGKSTQALAEDAPECEHVLGEMHTVKAQTCVEPGIGVRYCKDCHGAFNVVIPADGVSHPKVNAEGECEVCGATGINYVIDQEKSTESKIVVKGVPAENSDVTKIVIPAKIDEKPVYVSEDAFAGNEKIQSVEIQGSPFIGASAFEGCTNLSQVTIEDGTQTIASNAFKDCESLEKVDLPKSVTSVGADAFTGTKFYEDGWVNWEDEGLKTLSSNHCLLKADAYAAPHGISLLSVEDDKSYMDGITVIADEAFAGLSDLTEVTLPAGIITVGFNAFRGTAVRSVILPASAQNIVGLNGEGFKIYYLGSTAAWEKIGAQVPRSDVYFYAADEKDTLADNNYWYYGENNLPTPYIKLTEIVATKDPKTRFLRGEPFVFDGTVEARYADGSSVVIPNERLDINDEEVFKSDLIGSYEITVKYAYCQYTYTVNVTDAYVVTIDYGYDTPKSTASVEALKEGEVSNYTLPAAPARTGYAFTGWLFNGETKPAETPVTVEDNLTITAQWERLTPAITMDYVGGAWTEDSGYTVSEYDEASDSYTVTITAAPYRMGYTFKGWTYALKDAEPADVDNNIFTINLADDMAYTVKAVWEAKTPVITLNYAEGEKGTAEAAYGPLSEDSKYTVTVTGEPTRTGWKFTGWAATYNDDPVELVAEDGAYTYTFDLADEMTLVFTAQWEQLYTVTVTAPETATVEVTATAVYTENGTAYYAKETPVTFTVTVANGYKLAENGVKVEGADAEGYAFTIGEADVTITVTTEQVKVTVNVGGENATNENVTLSRSTDGAKAIFTLTQPTREGYDFAGWTIQVEGGEKKESYQEATYELALANSDVTVTFTANWTAIGYHFNITGAENANVTYKDGLKEAYNIGDTVKFKVEAKNGYILESVTYGDALVADQDGYYSVIFGADNINVTVVVRAVKVTYSITNEADGATLKLEQEGATATVTVEGTPSREGYRFDGWEIEVTGAEKQVGEDGSTVTLTLANTDVTVTYTAKWVEQYTVTYDLGGHSKDTVPAPETVDVNGTVNLPAAPNADGNWKFTGWLVDGEEVAREEKTQYTVTANVTVTAQWTQIYTVTVEYVGLDEADNGENVVSLEFDPQTYTSGTEVALMVEVVETTKYALNKVEATGCQFSGEGGVYSFTVGTSDITIMITLDRLYHVTVETVGDADASGLEYLLEPDAGYYKAGQEFELTVMLDDEVGYTLTVEATGADLLNSEEGIYTFSVGTSDVTVTITVKEIVKTYTVKLADGTKNVTLGDVNEEGYEDGATVTFTLTPDEGYGIKSVEGSVQVTESGDGYSVTIAGADVTITVELYYYGTLENPLSIADALALVEDLKLGKNAFTEQRVYAKGKITAFTDKTNYYGDVTLQDESQASKTILVYTVNMRDKSQSIDLNDIVIINGYIKNHEGTTIEFASKINDAEGYVYIEQLNRGMSDITVTNEGGATIDPQIPSTKENGQDVTFKVTAPDGKKISSVTVNGETIQADGEGNYKFTVHGDMTVVITVVDEGAAAETNFEFVVGDLAATQKWQDQSRQTNWSIDNNLSVSIKETKTNTNHNTGWYDSSKKEIRLYEGEGSEMTITALNGATIVSLKFTFSVQNSGVLVYNGTQYTPGVEIKVNASSAVFTVTHSSGSSNGQARFSKINGVYTGGKVLSDEEKVAEAAESYVLPEENKTYTEVKEYDLPTDAGNNVTITWALAGTSANCSIVGGTKLNVTSLPEEDETVELTATFNLNGKTATNDYTITIKKQTGGGQTGASGYSLVESTEDLIEGRTVVFVVASLNIVSGAFNSSDGSLGKVSVTIVGNTIESLGSGYEWTLKKGSGDTWQFVNKDGKLLYQSGKKFSISSGTSSWAISIDKTTHVASISANNYYIKYNNSGSNFFRLYQSGQADIQIYMSNSAAADEVQSDLEIVPAVYNGPVSTTPSDTAENSALWISLLSVGVVLLALVPVAVVFSLRKKSE